MLYFDKDKLDNAWDKAKALYDQEQLVGIEAIKSSTAMENPRAPVDTEGVIVFYCGPSDGMEKVTAYGQNILEKMSYYYRSQGHHLFNSPFFNYKTEAMTLSGTRRLGQMKNHLYRLPFL